MITNIRGTSGSGKSTVVFNLLKHFRAEGELFAVFMHHAGGEYTIPMDQEPDSSFDVHLGYQIFQHFDSNRPTYKSPLRIVGKYLTPCGGCDGIKTQDEVSDRVRAWYNMGYEVLFEGLLISTIVGRWAEMAESVAENGSRLHNMRFVFLNTPEEVCVERVKARRAAKGNLKPLNETNTRDKWRLMQTIIAKLQARKLYVMVTDGDDLTRRLIVDDWCETSPYFVTEDMVK